MIISGNNKRSISDQTGNVDFLFSVTPDQNSGMFSFGLSGENRTLDFRFENSRIYGPDNKLVSSYEKDTPTIVSGQAGQSSYDYYINSNLIALGSPCSSGKLSWFYFNSQFPVDFNGYVKGSLPSYEIDSTGKYLYQDYIVTGKIVNKNPNTKFRIFDVNINQGSSPYEVQGFTTGDIENTGYIYITSDQIGLNDYILPLILKTNFGDVDVNFVISGDYSQIPDVYLNISPDSTNVINNVGKNYNIQIANFPSGTEVGISLTYESGVTGKIYSFEEKVSDLTGRYLSGLVTGSRVFSSFEYGAVSGLDPKTNIWETGAASGDLSTNPIYATGFVSYNYEITGYGLGQGNLQIDFEVSGLSSGFYSGTVPLNGGLVALLAYNFPATGNSPGFATGIAPTGYGTIFVRPTGSVIISGLNPVTDYYSGIITAEKTFSGPISTNYAVTGVGWATGELFSGTVTTTFASIFEQGLYTFTKFYSGLIQGSQIATGIFDPSKCLGEQPQSSGLISGNFSFTKVLGCELLSGDVAIPITGYPSIIYAGGVVSDASNTLLVQPSGGFGQLETSEQALKGFFTRTKTSRMGDTPSGKGYFSNVINDCISNRGASEDLYASMWREEIQTISGSTRFDSQDNYIKSFSSFMTLSGTGGPANGSGAFVGQDSGVLFFEISGSGGKTVALRSILTSSSSIIDFYLYKNFSPYAEGWNKAGISFNGDTSIESPWQKWSEVLSTTIFGKVHLNDTIVVLEDLSSGYYSLYAFARPLPTPQVYFESPIFSGCENGKNILISISASGVTSERAWFEMTNYNEITAHSGVNYDPVFLAYQNTGLNVNGNRFYVGGYFEPNDGTVQTQSFTIPIYDNAAYGTTHEFEVSLSNPSGCVLGATSTALVQIIDNDFRKGTYTDYVRHFTVGNDIITGNNDDIAWLPSGIPFGDSNIPGAPWIPVGIKIPTWEAVTPDDSLWYDCIGEIESVAPQAAPACYPNCPTEAYVKVTTLEGRVDNNNRPVSKTISCPEEPCCSCQEAETQSITCPGYGTLTSKVLKAGKKCDSLQVHGVCSSSDYSYIGEVCAALGSTPVFDFSSDGPCSYKVYLIPKSQLTDPLGGPFIPTTNCEDYSFGYCDVHGTCIGYGPGANVSQVYSINNAKNYAAKTNGKVSSGPACEKLLVFLSVTCSSESTGPCGGSYCNDPGFIYPNCGPNGIHDGGGGSCCIAPNWTFKCTTIGSSTSTSSCPAPP